MKYLFTVYTVLFVSLMSSCDLKVNDEKSKQEFIDGCKEEFVTASGLEIDDAIIDRYCTCSADKILSKFSIIDLIQMNDTTSQVYSESQELIKPCLNDFNKQLEDTYLAPETGVTE